MEVSLFDFLLFDNTGSNMRDNMDDLTLGLILWGNYCDFTVSLRLPIHTLFLQGKSKRDKYSRNLYRSDARTLLASKFGKQT